MEKRSFKDKALEKIENKVFDSITTSLAKSIIKDIGLPYEEVEEDIKSEEVSITPTVVEESVPSEEIDLDKRVDKFLEEYYEYYSKKIGNYAAKRETIVMKNFIEKVAVWYELAYPDDKLYEKFPTEFVNLKDFINSLPDHERELLRKPKYLEECRYYDAICVYRDTLDGILNGYVTLVLTRNGVIEKSEGVYRFSDSRVSDKELIGLRLDKAVEVFEKAGVNIDGTELAKAVEAYQMKLKFYEGMLDAIMFRMIERNNRYYNVGTRRAYIFAKNFGRDVNIPVIYSPISKDKSYREFINTYIKDGGSIDIGCYIQYYYDKYTEMSKEVQYEKRPLRVNMALSNKSSYNTIEETQLYQRLTDALTPQLLTSDAMDELREDAIKQKRIERKLNRIRNN